MGRAVKNSLEIIIKQVRLEGGFESGGRIRVAECLRQIVPDRRASIRKRSFTKCFCVYGVTYRCHVLGWGVRGGGCYNIPSDLGVLGGNVTQCDFMLTCGYSLQCQ